MAGKYYGSNFWKGDFWNDDYWAEDGAPTDARDYFHANFFTNNFWNDNYYLTSEIGSGDVEQANSPNLPITGFSAAAGVSLLVEPPTAAIPIGTFNPSVTLDFDTFATTASVPINGLNASVQTSGYQLGDIDLRFVPNSAIVVTYGVVATAPGIPIGPMIHTVEDGGNVLVAASLAAIPINALNTTTRLDIGVEPLPVNIPINGFNTTAGIGLQIPATSPNITITTATHTVVATPRDSSIPATSPNVPISALSAVVAGSSPEIDTGIAITNLFATIDRSNYEICERSGRKVLPGTLIREWNGTMVRPESWERRHPQDFVRSRAEKLTGPERPEQDDTFIEDRYPAGVSANDL